MNCRRRGLGKWFPPSWGRKGGAGNVKMSAMLPSKLQSCLVGSIDLNLFAYMPFDIPVEVEKRVGEFALYYCCLRHLLLPFSSLCSFIRSLVRSADLPSLSIPLLSRPPAYSASVFPGIRICICIHAMPCHYIQDKPGPGLCVGHRDFGGNIVVVCRRWLEEVGQRLRCPPSTVTVALRGPLSTTKNSPATMATKRLTRMIPQYQDCSS